jgi:hypothetical protein
MPSIIACSQRVVMRIGTLYIRPESGVRQGSLRTSFDAKSTAKVARKYTAVRCPRGPAYFSDGHFRRPRQRYAAYQPFALWRALTQIPIEDLPTFPEQNARMLGEVLEHLIEILNTVRCPSDVRMHGDGHAAGAYLALGV